YRMFTSRAEHRLLLGCDTVYARLSPQARELGLLDDDIWSLIESAEARQAQAMEILQQTKLTPTPESQARVREVAGVGFDQPLTLVDLIRRPDLPMEKVLPLAENLPELNAQEDRKSVV